MRPMLLTLVALLALALAFAVFCNLWIVSATHARIYDRIEDLPVNEVALVLGTSPWTRSGDRSDHYRTRIEAATALYQSGKVKHILASGANPDETYNEPRKMYQALVAAGVPGEAITMDFAGFRTLDSVVRAKQIFGLESVTIISQRFHNYRALFIADRVELAAVAYAAQRMPIQKSLRVQGREFMARIRAVLDIYLLRTPPRFLGKAEPIVIPPDEEEDDDD